MSTLTLPAAPTSPREARRFVAAELAQAGYGDPDAALVIVSELVTNVWQHTSHGTVQVTVHIAPGEWAQLEVRDGEAATGQPSEFPCSPPPADAEHGRGLLLVSALSGGSCGSDGQGTTWARLPWAAAPAAGGEALLAAAGGAR
jgi:anti-sigma regulatory factor (Ser/Thr protein kinase)